jgi:hypothetical protein
MKHYLRNGEPKIMENFICFLSEDSYYALARCAYDLRQWFLLHTAFNTRFHFVTNKKTRFYREKRV